jgi:hypothetical protein
MEKLIPADNDWMLLVNAEQEASSTSASVTIAP